MAISEKKVTKETAKHAFEFLRLINDAETEDEQIALLKKWGNTLPLNMLLSLNFNKNIELELPEGAPPFKREEQTHFDLFVPLASQLGRLKACMKGNPIKRVAKERVFIEVVENVAPAEADVLVLCKDRALTDTYPKITAELVKKVFPNYVS